MSKLSNRLFLTAILFNSFLISFSIKNPGPINRQLQLKNLSSIEPQFSKVNKINYMLILKIIASLIALAAGIFGIIKLKGRSAAKAKIDKNEDRKRMAEAAKLATEQEEQRLVKVAQEAKKSRLSDAASSSGALPGSTGKGKTIDSLKPKIDKGLQPASDIHIDLSLSATQPKLSGIDEEIQPDLFYKHGTPD